MNDARNGIFIVLDGTNGSGKGTQIKKLEQRLKDEGRDVVVFDFPRYGNPSAYFVEKYLRGEYGDMHSVGPYRASLFFALDRYDASEEIRAALDRGAIVLSNRYVSANKGHQMAKMDDPVARKTFLDWVNRIEYDLHGIPVPDLTLFLHVPTSTAFDLVSQKGDRTYLKGEKRDIHEADRKHHEASEQTYLELCDMDTHECWMRIDCAPNGELLPIDTIHEHIYQTILTKLLSSER